MFSGKKIQKLRIAATILNQLHMLWALNYAYKSLGETGLHNLIVINEFPFSRVKNFLPQVKAHIDTFAAPLVDLMLYSNTGVFMRSSSSSQFKKEQLNSILQS